MTGASPAVSRAPLLLAALIGANLFSWIWALLAFGHNSALIAASLLAWSYGLRHAVDVDHIAAIDTVTRQLMQQGQRPTGVGAFFPWGILRSSFWPPSLSRWRPPPFKPIWVGCILTAA